jgi:magnesium transporter
MLNVFTLANGRLFQEEIDSLEALAHVKPVWVDLDAPTPEEKDWIVHHFGLTIPADAVDDDLEESARFYEEDNGELHIRSDFLIDDDRTPRNVRVAFILFNGVLFSVHAEELPVFRLLRLRARRIPAFIEDAKDVLLKLYDADAEYSADALEGIYDSLEAVSSSVLTKSVNDEVAGEALSAIAREEDLNGRIRRNVMDTRRAVSFMMRSRMLNAEQFEEARQILRQDQLPDGRHRRLHQHQPEQDHQDLFGGQRGPPATDPDCQYLRHELHQHARNKVDLRLPLCAGLDGGVDRGALRVLPAQGLVALRPWRCLL